MLTEQRFERILERLKVKKSITVAEITEDLGISESTARRDITALDKAGKLTKVFGGAVAAKQVTVLVVLIQIAIKYHFVHRLNLRPFHSPT